MQHRLRCVNHIFRQSGFARSAHRNGIIPGVAKDPAPPGQLGSARHSSQAQTQSPTPIKRISRAYKGAETGRSLSPAEAAKYHQARTKERLGVFSGDVAQTLEDIKRGEVNATSYLQQEIAGGTVSLEKVRMCLSAEFQRLSQFSRRERATMFRSEKSSLARTILEFLWRDNTAWMKLLVYDGDCATHLCYLGIAENLEPFLTRWLQADAGNRQEEPELANWRGKLFRCIICAFLIHRTDPSATRLTSLPKLVPHRAVKSPATSSLEA